jgi:two-component system sensor histidine kinase GlrK
LGLGYNALRIAYPKSFLKLLLIGFGLAMLPLLFAFFNAALYVDQLAEKSRSTVAQAVQATRASRVLVEQLTLMERSARQYFVLHDDALLENYTRAHEEFRKSISDLTRLPLGQDQRHTLDKLNKQETVLHQEITLQATGPATTEAIIAQFVDLSNQAQLILAENSRLIDRESAALAETAEHTQQMMAWQTITLIPVGLLMAAVITFLVAQPIRRMDAAIRRLGEGHYAEPISIDGPGDLRNLGERLDWLRIQLEKLELQKQRFLRHVSHELKTPLTAIREGSELLNDEVGGTLSPQQKEIAGILRESSLRLQKMIENLLNYTAVQFQKPTLKIEELVLPELVEEILSNYKLTLASKQLIIHRDFRAVSLLSDPMSSEPVYSETVRSDIMQGDKVKLHAVIDNLVSNAIKYTPPSGSIQIRIEFQVETVVIDVHDSGAGVMASDRISIFDPFYRGAGPNEGLVEGSGIGLSIAKEYVDAHGGEISLLPSEYGAHFRVRLPLEPHSS